ncbi:tyrosine-type recombinase/integrase [Halobacterium sp. NMX12-1]|uniref:Tyrosine-type recombinase/integrase n=1 Tax=Halobacterium sp. NMX12-1 TaxID=3166650 RepID=A0AAU8CCJ1_9EURY
MTERRRRDPSDLTPREAKERYLRRRRTDSTEKSVQGFHSRLKLFVEWCEGVGITRIGDLQPYDINEYYDIRSGDVAPSTVEGEMYTLKKFCEFLEQLGAVDDDLAEKVPIPDVPEEARSSDTKLDSDQALALINFHRNNPATFGTRAHVFLELAWYTGARQGGLRALDVRDFDRDQHCLEFRHRPSTGTPLKNKLHGERAVGIPSETTRAVSQYLNKHRYEVHDDHGRQPLLASRNGRPTDNTVRVWSYLATLPCTAGSCPHGKEPPSCDWTERDQASKCPSSRAPHHVRTGSITWQLNSGIPIEVVSQRVNAGVDVIEEYYDKPSTEELWRRRRQQMEQRRNHLDNLDLTDD